MNPKTPRYERLAEALRLVLWDEHAADEIAAWVRGGGRIVEQPRGELAPIWKAGSSGRASRLAVTDPREAWEAMAARDLISMEDVANERRRFVCPMHPVRSVCALCRGERVGPYPFALAQAVAFAADWSGVLAAEAVAREYLGQYAGAWWTHERWEGEIDDLARQDPWGRLSATVREVGYGLEYPMRTRRPSSDGLEIVCPLVAPMIWEMAR